jgi:hypothetical protein
MLMTSIQAIVAAVLLLAQPVQTNYDPGRFGGDVAAASEESPAQSAPPAVKAVADSPAQFRPARKPAAKTGAASRSTPGGAANSRTRPAPKQVAVANPAASGIAAPAPGPQVREQQAGKSPSAPPNDAARLVAILAARPEIKSVSDLTDKTIAIDDRQSSLHAVVRTAIVAAGATGVQLTEGQATAINRVVNGEVPAAVLTLESPEAAETFPDIEGFRIFRIPLSPGSMKARLERP